MMLFVKLHNGDLQANPDGCFVAMPTLPNEAYSSGGVYVLVDPTTGDVIFVGQTKAFDRREKEWGRSRDPDMAGADFDPKYPTDDYDTRRGAGQKVWEDKQPDKNKNRPVSPRNPNRERYEKAADDYPDYP
ncbi:MAG: hypothetical protein U0821_24630 [Chloroflexota bacterium]